MLIYMLTVKDLGILQNYMEAYQLSLADTKNHSKISWQISRTFKLDYLEFRLEVSYKNYHKYLCFIVIAK